MKRTLAALVLCGFTSTAALGFDPAIDAVIAYYKEQKPVRAADLVELMRLSERWCYTEEAGACAWSDVYLDVTAENARFEISNAYSAEVDISSIEAGVFQNNRQICETGTDWTQTVHARNRAGGLAVTGRALDAIKNELAANLDQSVIDCFDYLYVASDAAAQTVTLVQRQYTADTYVPEADVTVTLHFDAARAQALTLRW